MYAGRGISLSEVIVVIAILAILVAMVALGMGSVSAGTPTSAADVAMALGEGALIA